MNSSKDFIKKVERYLEQQKEVYGKFAIPKTDRQQINNIDGDSKNADGSPEEEGNKELASRSKKELSSESDISSTQSSSDHISECNSLEELRTLCERSSELKTDLEGTNLVFGVGDPDADLMIIGEAPGYNEDQQGEPFVGEAGQLLDKIIGAINFSRDEIFIANILKHRPPNNRDPKPEERERSLPYLMRQIELVNPKLILCVGRVSATTLLGKDTSLGKLRGTFHAFNGRELMATYHPAALLRNPKWKRPTWDDVQKLRERYDELGGK